jgi:hypothetical protein
MKNVITVLLAVYCTLSPVFAQEVETFSIDKQTLPTTVRSITTDDQGNVYYFGTFRGALTIENDTLAFGNGGSDIFIVKKNASGSFIWAKNYGNESNESNVGSIHYSNGYLYTTMSVSVETNLGGIPVTLLNNSATSCLMRFDTAGNVNWIKRTNASFANINTYQNGIRVEGTINISSGNMLIEADIVLVATGFNNRFFIDFNNEGIPGRIINTFQNNVSSLNPAIMFSEPRYAGNHLYMLFATSEGGLQFGNNKLNINGTEIGLGNNKYLVLVKTDSLGNNVKYKILNPESQLINTGNFNASRMSISQAGDSVYLPLMGVYGSRYNIDGFNVDLQNISALATLDTNLITRTVRVLNTNAGNEGNSRIKYSSFIEYGKHYYISGTFYGRNQAPKISQIPAANYATEVFNGTFYTLDNNGPGKSFLIKVSRDLQFKKMVWLGDHYPYEASELGFERYVVKNGMINFVNSLDNVWNPWQVDTSLNVIAGAMKGNADRNETLTNIHYFANGSKVAFGLVSGMTALDTNIVPIPAIPQKNELVIIGFDKANKVTKYTRVFTSFAYIQLLKSIRKNNKVYVLLNLSAYSNQEGNNYIKIDSTTWIIPNPIGNLSLSLGYRILLTIDELGSITYTNLYNLGIGPAKSFDVYKNGDLLIMTDNLSISFTLNGNTFPSVSGSYIARITPNGNITQAMKIHTNGLIAYQQPHDILIGGNEKSLFAIYSGGFRNFIPSMEFYVTRNGNQQSLINVPNPLKQLSGFRQYHMTFKTSFEENHSINLTGPGSPLGPGNFSLIHNGSIYFNFINGVGVPQALRYNGKIVVEDSGLARSYFIRVDTSGSFAGVKTIKNTKIVSAPDFNLLSLKEHNNNLYFSGIQFFKLKFGPVEIPYTNDNDALTIKMDTALNLLRYYRYASELSDVMQDCDVYKDSVISFALNSQLKPILQVGPQSEEIKKSSPGLRLSDFNPAGYMLKATQLAMPPELIYSVKNGNWHDPTTWSTGAVPLSPDRVIIRHKVTITANASCNTAYMEPLGDIKLLEGVVLDIRGN